ncbi:hypothetical protein BCR44DRAFT_1246742 [Catenaria anguillulae PL171]|uniref:Oxysterol-binding protein n=1 Tax=Catenaria anguillulae PL171 TaxID=765915 RepID=A0A1Y2HXP8_9FUNG|nr:hypothetical protein BCR44DRAFT_1246742 [Catenaria anguillulae PL171]
MAKGTKLKPSAAAHVAASAPVSTGVSAASLKQPGNDETSNSSAPDLDRLKLGDNDTESNFEVEDDDGTTTPTKRGSSSSVAAAANAPPLVDDSHKDSFFSFLKSIIGKDVDQMRVAVPLWLLEPVSNLEYLASLEYLEHFVQAPAQPTPLGRMVNVTTMLLSSLKKATKKAKKPINPILSEVFFANFHSGQKPPAQANGTTSTVEQEDDEVHEDKDDPTLPPCCWLASRFRIIRQSLHSMRHVPQTVDIPAHNEHYNVTYPDANLTGVLTMNFRLMWTGTCTVECPQSGLKTTITFKEKRWFGKDTYELTGTIAHASSPKSPLATLSGNWNAAIHIDYADSTAGPQLLFDSSTTPPAYHMHIPPRAHAPENFSHNVWGDVMSAMVAGDAGKANRLKTEVENRQRAVAKERAEGKLEAYVPKLFRYDPKAKSQESRVEYIGGELPDRKTDLVEWFGRCGKPAS